MTVRCLLPALALVLGTTGCTVKNKGGMPGDRDSGQSRLMGQTFAGQNSCNPESHKRPFIIEWDATDRSSFEAQAASDIIVVKYEGCALTVLDECKNDSVRGEQGAYMPPAWTSGALETIDIQTEGELVAKLPLGVATLGARVAGGEQFHMEYYVAGTRNATRDAVYRADLAQNPGCEGATHFVYAYNLGAFALGSATGVEVDASGSAYGFGAEAHTAKSKSAEKKGGDLAVCKADDATEVQDCQTPIRLSLREIRDGDNPDETAKKAPETDASLNAAGQLSAKLDMGDEARAHMETAQRKFAARDGKGCLSELDQHAVLDPKHKSTDSNSPLAYTRATCLMLAGKCKAGKKLMRKVLEKGPMASQQGPEAIDRGVGQMVNMYCQGSLPPREDLLRSYNEIAMSMTTKKESKFCSKHFAVIKKHYGKVKAKDDEDFNIINLGTNALVAVPKCFQRAGDCKNARSAHKQIVEWLAKGDHYYFASDNFKKLKGKERADAISVNFEAVHKKCAGK